jgi:hypothetical protein
MKADETCERCGLIAAADELISHPTDPGYPPRHDCTQAQSRAIARLCEKLGVEPEEIGLQSWAVL